jgi:hypothetical protein
MEPEAGSHDAQRQLQNLAEQDPQTRHQIIPAYHNQSVAGEVNEGVAVCLSIRGVGTHQGIFVFRLFQNEVEE